MSDSGKVAGSGVARRKRMLRVGVQVVGFMAGLGSLAWCVSLALRPENQKQFKSLVHAPPQLLIGMLGLSLATVVLNGLLFWIAIRPIRPLRVMDVLATNGICMFLAYLPLKAGAIVRVLIHNRRDKVPLLLIGSWFGAMAVTMVVGFAPLILATIWHGQVDARWIGEVAAMEVVGGLLLVVLAGLFKGQRGVDRLHRIASRLRLRPIEKLLKTNQWAHMHPGFDILATPWCTFGSLGLRLCDAAVHSARFLVAAHVLGVALPLREAVPVSLTFFLVGALSPAGMAGLREGAATGLAGLLLHKTGAREETFATFAAVALLVTATEALVFMFGAAVGVAWLRPDRLMRLSRPRAAEENA